ncbi:MAG TPA: GAF domain-containing protein, partial [Rhodopila sp.]
MAGKPARLKTSTIGAQVEHFDLATVITVSQAVAGEIVLEKLIDTLMRMAMAQAGAERALLILARDAELRITAEAITHGDTVAVHLHDDKVTTAMVPEAVLHYALHTRESVILNDAATDPVFATDSYIRQRRAQSILCLPLINQGKLIGVFYLENNLAPRVFTPARISVLRLVASQAAIALENARLYRDLATREAKIRRLFDANIIGIFTWEFGGRILEANDAFLRMVGYDRQEFVASGLNWRDLTPPEWRPRIRTPRELDEQLKTTSVIQPFEKAYFRKDGSQMPALLGAAPFEQGQDQGVAF